jgi:23S rRNA pseudouridine1911/1915/1917 synthase
VVHPGAGHAAGTLVHGLLARYPEMAGVGDPDRPGIVHRLDKDTSGLLMVARTGDAFASLSAQLRNRTVRRSYLALVWGHLDAPSGMVDAPVGRAPRTPTRIAVTAGGREARTGYEVVESYSDPVAASLVRCRLETGRTHQIRVHLTAIGHPVVGDARYGGRREPLADIPRMWLHAAELGFLHPATAEPCVFTSVVPADLSAVLGRLG